MSGAEEQSPAALAPAIREAYAKIESLAVDEVPDVALPFVARYARDHGALPLDVAEQHLCEYKRFLAIKAVLGRAVPPPAVDAVFHTHLIFTRSYRRFSEEILGSGEFIHHEPCVGGDGEELAATYKRTLACYEAAFGAAPPSDIWLPSGSTRVRTTIVPVKELLLLRRDAFAWRAECAMSDELVQLHAFPGMLGPLFEAQLAERGPTEGDDSVVEKVLRLLGSSILAALEKPADFARSAMVCKDWYLTLWHADLLPSPPEVESSSDDEDGYDDCG